MMRAIACLLSVCLLGASPARAAGTAAAPAAASPGAAASTQLLRTVRERLVQSPVVRGAFTQEKTIKGFQNPLRSSGRFVIAQGKGIVWQVQQPFASVLRVTPDTLQSVQADGQVDFQLQAQQEPALRAINSMLFAVMAADVAVLPQHFDIQGSLQGKEGWRLTLVPRDKMLAQWLVRIDLQGDRFVREVRLQEAQGDASVIVLHNPAAERALQAEDARLFE